MATSSEPDRRARDGGSGRARVELVAVATLCSSSCRGEAGIEDVISEALRVLPVVVAVAVTTLGRLVTLASLFLRRPSTVLFVNALCGVGIVPGAADEVEADPRSLPALRLALSERLRGNVGLSAWLSLLGLEGRAGIEGETPMVVEV
jgi:hypothetical protein